MDRELNRHKKPEFQIIKMLNFKTCLPIGYRPYILFDTICIFNWIMVVCTCCHWKTPVLSAHVSLATSVDFQFEESKKWPTKLKSGKQNHHAPFIVQPGRMWLLALIGKLLVWLRNGFHHANFRMNFLRLKSFWASKRQQLLGGGFKYFYFHPYLGKIPNLTNIFHYFSKGLKPPTRLAICFDWRCLFFLSCGKKTGNQKVTRDP